MSKELKPCPFCEGEASPLTTERTEFWSCEIECFGCSATIRRIAQAKSTAEILATKAWNTRAAQITQEEAQAAFKGLTHYQAWRSSDYETEECKMPNPKDMTKWIDIALKSLKSAGAE